jgi:ribosomal protein L15
MEALGEMMDRDAQAICGPRHARGRDRRAHRWGKTKGKGNPAGRKPGSRNRLSEAVICALLRDFSKHGEKAIAKVRRTHPAAYLKICVLLVPRENKVEHSRKVSELSDQQLNAMIEALSSRLEARAAGIDVPPLICQKFLPARLRDITRKGGAPFCETHLTQ